MISTTAAAVAALAGNARRFRARILIDNAEMGGYIRSADVYKGSCGDGTFIVGSAYAGYVELVIDRCPVSLAGKRFALEIGVMVNDSPEYVKVGTYTATQVSGNSRRLNVVGTGPIGALMGAQAPAMTGRISAVLGTMASECGVIISVPSDLSTTSLITVPEGLKWREVLAYIAGLYFGFAYETPDGNIRIVKHSSNASAWAVNDDMTTHDMTVAEDGITIHGVSVATNENSASFMAGDPIDMTLVNPLMTQELFDAYNSNILGVTYTPATLPITLGTYLLEPCDQVIYTPAGASDGLTVLPMDIRIHFDGGLTTAVTASDVSQDEYSQDSYRGVIGQTLDRIVQRMLEVERLIARKITVTDANGNVIFDADADNHAVSVGGWTIENGVISTVVTDPDVATVKRSIALDAEAGQIVIQKLQADDAILGDIVITKDRISFGVYDGGLLWYRNDLYMSPDGQRGSFVFDSGAPYGGQLAVENYDHNGGTLYTGDSNISGVGDGTVTGAIDKLSKAVSVTNLVGNEKVLTNNAPMTVASVAFKKGTYLLTGVARFAASTAGRRTLLFSKYSNSAKSYDIYAFEQISPSQSGVTYSTLTWPVKIDADGTTVYFNLSQNSGGDLAADRTGIKIVALDGGGIYAQG